MQPFCSTTTGAVGASNARSPSPSDTNTTTFSRSPFPSVTTSCVITGVGCCFAHTGSADMLIGLAIGALPSKCTVPRTEDVVLGAGPPAFAPCGSDTLTPRDTITVNTHFCHFILHL